MFLTIKVCTNAKLNFLKIELTICIKMDLALNNQQILLCHKTQTTKLSQAKIIKSEKKPKKTMKILFNEWVSVKSNKL